MSHFTKVSTQLTDRDALLSTLADIGFGSGRVEVHDTPVPLQGFPMVRQRARTGEIVVRKRWLRPAYSDLGFERVTPDEPYQIWADSDWLARNPQLVRQLTRRYAYHVVLATMTQQGYTIAEEATDGTGEVRLVLRRYA